MNEVPNNSIDKKDKEDNYIIDFLDIKTEYNVIDIGGRDGFFSKKMLKKNKRCYCFGYK